MYSISEATNDLLSRISEKLKHETPYSEPEFSMNEATNDVLERIRLEMCDSCDEDDFDDGEAGEGEAYNPTDVDEQLDLYLDSIMERLVQAGADEDDAAELIFLVADDCTENGELPPMPGEDSSDDEVAVWMGSAKTMGFTRKVLSMVGL